MEVRSRGAWLVTLPFVVTITGGVAWAVNLGLEAALAPALVTISAAAHLAVAAIYGSIALALALILAGLAGLACLLRRRISPFPTNTFAILTALGSGAAMWFLGRELASGAWVAQQSWASAVPWFVATAGGVGVGIAARLAAWSRWPRAITALLAATGLGAIVTDVVVLPGLYPLLHLTIRLVAVGLFGAAITRVFWLHLPLPRGRAAWTLGALGACLSLAAPIAWWQVDVPTRTELVLRGGAATEFVRLLHQAPSVTYLARELQRLETQHTPLPPLSPAGTAEAAPPVVQNVLVLFVDTLRADALPPTRGENTAFATDADTPFLDDLLQRCHRFERAYAQSSATHRSIPASFRSIQTWEYSAKNGTALGTVMASQGIETSAVINNYFFEPRFGSSQRLLAGFDRVRVYDSHQQKDVLPLADEAFGELGEDRFFAWVHFFAMHHPGYNDGLLSKSLAPEERYQRSLRWLDRTLGQVIADLERHGHADDTAIVLASDHGEGLGANNINTHGPTIFDEEIRVPLAICLPPGHAPGRVIHHTTSNIDLVPTLHDLMGLPPDPAHRGRSFAALLRGEDDDALSPAPYYFENSNKRRVGIAFEDSKFIYHPKDQVFFRFDLAADPTEEENLFTPTGAVDAQLRQMLFQLNPWLLEAEAKKPENRPLIARHLAGVDPASPAVEHEFLLALGGIADHPDLDAEAARIFRGTDDPRVRFWVMRHFRYSPILGELVRERIEAVRGSDDEASFVDLAAAASVPAFDEAWVRRQIAELPADDTLWSAWLRLVRDWKKRGGDWAPALVGMLRVIDADPTGHTAGAVHRALDTIASARWRNPPAELRDLVRARLDDPRPIVRRSAIEAAGALRDRKAYDTIRAFARGEGGVGRRVRQAALHALADIGRRDAAADIVEAARDDVFLAMDAFDALVPLGDAEGIRTLGKIHRRYAGDARRAAKRAEKKAAKTKR